MRKPELLVPASSLEVLKIATGFGADAVYIGGEAFGLRAKAPVLELILLTRNMGLTIRRFFLPSIITQLADVK